MPRDASGIFQRLYRWINDRDAGVNIRADRMDEEFDGMVQDMNDVTAGHVPWRGTWKGLNGTASLPAYTFDEDQDTGMFRKAADTVALSAGGVERVTASAASVDVAADAVGVTANDSVTLRASGEDRVSASATAVSLTVGDTTLSVDENDAYLNGAALSSLAGGASADPGGIGVDQEWVDVTSERAFDVEYRNDTGKPLQLYVSGENLVITYKKASWASWDGIQGREQISGFIIPDNYDYKPVTSTQGQYRRIDSWWELRGDDYTGTPTGLGVNQDWTSHYGWHYSTYGSIYSLGEDVINKTGKPVLLLWENPTSAGLTEFKINGQLLYSSTSTEDNKYTTFIVPADAWYSFSGDRLPDNLKILA